MNKYVEEKRYRGKVQAIILDWSGTTADAYVVAPAIVFFEVVKRQNVEISMAEARGPMGLRKDLHIEAILDIPSVQKKWEKNITLGLELKFVHLHLLAQNQQ